MEVLTINFCNCSKKQQRENNAQQGDRTTPKQVNERRNRLIVPTWVYAIDKQLTPESFAVMEGKNFENEIFVRGRECENPKIILNFFLFLKN